MTVVFASKVIETPIQSGLSKKEMYSVILKKKVIVTSGVV